MLLRRLRPLAILLLFAGTMFVGASPAQAAAAQNCYGSTGPTYGYWSTAKGYDYNPGEWCMRGAGYRLVFQPDGNLVVYRNTNVNDPAQATYSSKTSGRGIRLSFQKDGNMVVYVSSDKSWATGTSGTAAAFRLLLIEASGSHFLQLNQEKAGQSTILWQQRV
jgi:hypothetical protein